MDSVTELVEKIIPDTREDSTSMVVISVLQELESFIQLFCLTELECEDIIEPWLDYYLVRLHLLQLIHSHFVLTVTDESYNQMMPSLWRKSEPKFFHLLQDTVTEKVVGMNGEYLVNPVSQY